MNDVINKIDYFIEEFMNINNIDDIKKVSAMQYDYFLRYLGKNIFALEYHYIDINKHLVNIFNVYKTMIDIYIPLCERFNKIPKLSSLCKFININNGLIYNFSNNKYTYEYINDNYFDYYINNKNDIYILNYIFNDSIINTNINSNNYINLLANINYYRYSNLCAQAVLQTMSFERRDGIVSRLSDDRIGLITIANEEIYHAPNNGVLGGISSPDTLPDFSATKAIESKNN